MPTSSNEDHLAKPRTAAEVQLGAIHFAELVMLARAARVSRDDIIRWMSGEAIRESAFARIEANAPSVAVRLHRVRAKRAKRS